MDERTYRIRCFVVPLSIVIAVPFLLTPAAVIPWYLARNSSKPSVTIEIDLLASLKRLETFFNGTLADGSRLRSETPAPWPRHLRRSLDVRQDPTGPPSLGEGGDYESHPKNRHILLRPVSGDLRQDPQQVGGEGSGDDPEGGIKSEAGRSGEEGSSNFSHH